LYVGLSTTSSTASITASDTTSEVSLQWVRIVPWLVCGIISALSLLWAAAPTYDPWSWLVWSRELTGHSLQEFSSAGATGWKPLPVLFQAPLNLLGFSNVPTLWVWISRTALFMIPVFGWRLGRMSAGRLGGLAGAVAAALTPGMLLYLGGLSEPIVALFLLVMVEKGLQEKGLAAWLAGLGAVLGRPEMLAIVAPAGLWMSYRKNLKIPYLIIGIIGAALLWMSGDWISGGKPLAVAGRADVSQEPTMIQHTAWPAWYMITHQPLGWVLIGAGLLAGIAAWVWQDRVGKVLSLLILFGAGGLILFTQFGYPGVPRYIAPVLPALTIMVGIAVAHTVQKLVKNPAKQMIAAITMILVLALPQSIGQAHSNLKWYQSKNQQTVALKNLVSSLGGHRFFKECWGAAPEPANLTSALAYYADLRLDRTGRSVTRGINPRRAPQVLLVRDRSSEWVVSQAKAHRLNVTKLGSHGKWSIWSTLDARGRSCGHKILFRA